MERYRLARIIVACLVMCAVIAAASASNAEVGGLAGGVVAGDPDDWTPAADCVGVIAGIVVGILHLFEFHWLS